MNFDGLKNPELQKKLQNAKSPEDILQIAREEGYELTSEELEDVTGGGKWYEPGKKGCANMYY